MQKSKFWLLLIAVLFAANGALAQGQKVASYTNTQVVNVPQTFQGALITPMLCDYEVLTQQAVETEFIPTVKLSGILPHQLNAWMEEFVFEAQAKLIKEYNADAIIGLSRVITTSADGTIKVIVRGFPVKYVNFRKATERDVWMVQFYNHINPHLQKVNLGDFKVTQQ